MEALIGEKLLAWAGGVAVLLGIAFFVAVAIGRGWLDETARIVLSYVVSAALVGVGAWLHEKRGRTQASLAMVGTGIAAAFLATTAAIQLYGLFPAPAGLVVGFGIGATATALAIRWNSQTVAAIGIVGALLAPVMVDAGAPDAGIGFVAVALAAATGVLLWRRWEWLALAAFAVSAPQLIGWCAQADSAVAVVLVSVVFWALYMVAALGYDVRVKGALPRTTACLLAVAAPLLASAGGYWSLRSLGHSAAGDWLIAVLGIAHVALGLVGRRKRRISVEVERLLLAGGLVMGNVAYGLIASGPAVSIGWAASAVGLGFVAHKGKLERDQVVFALGAQLCLSLLHVLLFDAPPADSIAAVSGGNGAVASLIALGIAAFVSARLTRESRVARIAFDVTALVVLAYVTPFVLNGPAITVAWAGQAVALARIAKQHDDRLAYRASWCFLGLALVSALLSDAPATLLAHSGLHVDAVIGGGAVALAALSCARLMTTVGDDRFALGALAVAAFAYTVPFALDGPALVGAWSAAAVALVTGARVLRGADRRVAWLGAPAMLALAVAHALAMDATIPDALSGKLLAWPAVVALLFIALAGLGSERLWLPADPLAPCFRGVGLAALLYAPAFVTGGAVLVAVWAAAAAALAYEWRRCRDDVAAGGALAIASVALIHTLMWEAPVVALGRGVHDLPAALLATGALAAALIGVSRLVPRALADGRVRLALEAAGAVAAIYAVSVAIVSAFPGHAPLDPSISGLGVRQQGQMLLSAFWAGTGLMVLVWGLVFDERSRRIGGLALLTLALTKVFVYDLAALESIYRVVSFVALGVLLMVGGFAYQRMRPDRAHGVG